jgi:non-homologous end joining protein Ku
LGGRKYSEDFADCDAAALRNKCLSLAQKRSGKPIAAKARPKGENVVDLMDALKRNSQTKAAAGQKEMLLPIGGKRAAKAEARGLESPEMSMTGGYRNETKK